MWGTPGVPPSAPTTPSTAKVSLLIILDLFKQKLIRALLPNCYSTVATRYSPLPLAMTLDLILLSSSRQLMGKNNVPWDHSLDPHYHSRQPPTTGRSVAHCIVLCFAPRRQVCLLPKGNSRRRRHNHIKMSSYGVNWKTTNQNGGW